MLEFFCPGKWESSQCRHRAYISDIFEQMCWIFVPIDSDNNFGGILLLIDIYILVEFADVIPEPTFCEIACHNSVCWRACQPSWSE